MELNELAITKVTTVEDVDVNVTTKSTLYTVPPNKKFIVVCYIPRGASLSLTTAQFGIGFNADANDVVASAAHTELTGSTLYKILFAKAGAVVGNAGDVLGLKCTVAQGASATVDVDVFGYLLDA